MSAPVTVLAAGTVLWRTGPTGLEIALVHRPKYDDWSLPKGKAEAREHLAVTAVRETAEETGFRGVLGRFLGELHYDVPSEAGPIPKAVSYWAMEARGGSFTENTEVDRLRWVPAADAHDALTRADDRAPVQELLAAPASTTTVLLVRHGDAGSRASWQGPDDLRPLNAVGERQAAAIAAVVPMYGPVQVAAAQPLRCVQTVAPLAQVIGVAVDPAPGLSESTYEGDPGPATAYLGTLVDAGRPVAVCSQGGVIPGLLDSFWDSATRGPRTRVARKGSVWVLSFATGRLVAADYLQDLLPVT